MGLLQEKLGCLNDCRRNVCIFTNVYLLGGERGWGIVGYSTQLCTVQLFGGIFFNGHHMLIVPGEITTNAITTNKSTGTITVLEYRRK